MTRDEVVTIIKNRLARPNDTVLGSAIKLEIRAAQERLEGMRELPWFLVTESSYTTTTDGEERVAVPADFLMEVDQDALWIEDTAGNWTVLRKSDYDDIRALYNSSGLSTHYSLVGNYFRLRPAPDAGYTLHMMYYGKDTVLADELNIENNWLKYAAELVIAETGRVIAMKYVRNEKVAVEFTQDLVVAKRELMATNQARQDANRTYMSDN